LAGDMDKAMLLIHTSKPARPKTPRPNPIPNPNPPPEFQAPEAPKPDSIKP
jgi:hypothetical protein